MQRHIKIYQITTREKEKHFILEHITMGSEAYPVVTIENF